MDLPLLLRVLWRFKPVVLLGLTLAVTLSFLAYVKVDFGDGFKLTYREAEQWESLSTLFVTDPGFNLSAIAGGESVDVESDAVAQARMLSLTNLYMQLATSDEVLRLMARQGPIEGVVQTFPITSTGDTRGDPLPMLTFSSMAMSPAAAHRQALRHINAFLEFLRRDQLAKGIPPDERVKVEVVRQPQAPTLLTPRKKTRPIIVLLTVLSATVGLAFILENLRPRVRVVPGDSQTALSVESSRRTA